MSRVNFVETITLPLGPGGSLLPVAGIAATPYSINPADETEGPQAPAYAGRTGNILAASLATDVTGTVSFWVEAGDYNIHFDDQQSPSRIQPYVRGFNAAVIDQNALIVGAQNLIQFTGDYKHSEQAGDHGLTSSGAYEWLLIRSESDGGGRKVDHTLYQALWNALGQPAVASDGTFRLPNVSSRSLVATGATANTGLTARVKGSLFGSENASLAVANLPVHIHVDSGHTHPNSVSLGKGAHQHYNNDNAHGWVAPFVQNTWAEVWVSGQNTQSPSFPYPAIWHNGNYITNGVTSVITDTGDSVSITNSSASAAIQNAQSSDGSQVAAGTPHTNMQPSYGANLFIKT